MYCNKCCAGADHARCGITALGNTHSEGAGAARRVIRFVGRDAVAQFLRQLIREVGAANPAGEGTGDVAEIAGAIRQ